MDLYFGGAEIPGWAKLLQTEGVEHVALSYMGLRRRTKFTRPWVIADKFPANQKVFLDSGAYTVNNAEEEKYSQRELKDIAAHYMSFVAQNIDGLAMVSEFDVKMLGRDWIEAAREDFWDDIPEGKFLPIWHGDNLEELDRLAQRYARVGVPQTALGGRNLTPTLNGIVSKYGTKLHGVAMTKPDEMAAVRWDSVASTSWISPSQYGDTIVWTGKELKRYPKKYKEQSRKRHRTLFDQAGFDHEKIEADDSTEVLRLSIWSWRQQAANIDRHRKDDEPSNSLVNTATGEITETGDGGVDTQGYETRNPGTTVARVSRDLVNLPVMGMLTAKETVVNDDGVNEERDVPLIQMRSDSMRMCDTCFLKDKCPAFVPNNNCAYNIPIEVKTKEQMRALQDSLISMQSQRVLFMKMAEDMEGGYADPNLSNEVDRLQKLIKTKTELESDQFSIKFEAKGSSGQAGMISRLFGRDAGEIASSLPVPVAADLAIESADIYEAELVDLPAPARESS